MAATAVLHLQLNMFTHVKNGSQFYVWHPTSTCILNSESMLFVWSVVEVTSSFIFNHVYVAPTMPPTVCSELAMLITIQLQVGMQTVLTSWHVVSKIALGVPDHVCCKSHSSFQCCPYSQASTEASIFKSLPNSRFQKIHRREQNGFCIW